MYNFILDGMVKKRVMSLLVVMFIILGSVFVSSEGITGNIIKEDFEVDSLLLKVSLVEDRFIEKEIKISGLEEGDISLSVENIEGVSLSDNDFFLNSGESKKIRVSFNSSDLNPGVHVGKIKVVSAEDSASIPIIFEIESKDVFFDLNLDVSNKYSSVKPGEDFVVDMKIYDLANLGTSKVEIEYYVRDTNGNVLISEAEGIIVSDESSISKTIALPKDISEGTYIFSAVIKYQSSIGVSSRFFDVSNKGSNESNLNFGSLNMFSILMAIFLIVLLGLLVYFIRSRDKMILGLRRYNSMELKRQKDLLLSQAKILSKSSKDVDRGEINREVKEKVKSLKKKQKERVSAFKSLKRKGDSASMKKKLEEWKKKGYDTSPLDYKLKGLSSVEMKKIMAKHSK